MYSTCIFCTARLGTNEAIEHFPVGRRLAFDAAGGRLWVVCRTCERSFRVTQTRVSTENIALARLAEGTELVRIGEPLRREFAAWRYGDQFRRRARRMWTYGIAAGGGRRWRQERRSLLPGVPLALTLVNIWRDFHRGADPARAARPSARRDTPEPAVRGRPKPAAKPHENTPARRCPLRSAGLFYAGLPPECTRIGS